MSDKPLNAQRFRSRNSRLSILPDTDGSRSDFYDDNSSTSRSTIPKMELLKINYIKRSKSPYNRDDSVELRAKDPLYHPIQIARPRSEGAINFLPKFGDSRGRNSAALKYAVYKKHNNAANDSARLQYCNNDIEPIVLAKQSKIRRKYFVFDNRKKTNFQTIQFYFDSKSYERHVDNKIYGILGDDGGVTIDSRHTSSRPPLQKDTKTWSLKKMCREKLSYAKVTADDESNKQLPYKSVKSSSDDHSQIDQIFANAKHTTGHDDQTAGSLKKVKKLFDRNFENRCTCHIEARDGSAHSENHLQKLIVNHSSFLRQHIYLSANHIRKQQEHQQSHLKLIDAIDSKKIYAKHYCNNNDPESDENRCAINGVEKSSNICATGTISNIKKPLKPNDSDACSNGSNNSIVSATVQNTCGYKNCTFTNCPMSTTSSSGDDFVQSKRIKSEFCKIKDPHHHQSEWKTVDEHATNDTTTIVNNMKNIQKSIVDLKFSGNNQNFNNSIKLKSVDKLNFNSKTNSNRKTSNLIQNAILKPIAMVAVKVRDTRSPYGRVRFNNRPPSLSESSSSTSSEQCEIVPDYPTDKLMMDVELAGGEPKSFVQHIRSLFPTKFGCDGAIFWNDCYYYDEHACCNCRQSTDLLDIGDSDNAANEKCVCDNKQVYTYV